MSINSGFIVITKTGKKGVTYVNKPKLNGKVVVFLYDKNDQETEDGIWCDPKTLKVIGFID